MNAILRTLRSHAPRPRAVAAVLLLLATSVAVLLATAAPAAAHASLLGTSPGSDEVLAEAPAEVVLTFSEDVATSGDAIRVLDPAGKRSDDGEIGRRSADTGTAYGVGLADGLADGTYTVAWHVVSTDGHPISGAFVFSIGAPSQTTVELPGEAVGGGLTGLLYNIARYAAYTGFLVLAGSVVFVLGCWQSAARLRVVQRLTLAGWTTLTAATMALLLLRHPYTTGEPVSLSGLSDVIETKAGAALTSRLLLLAAVALFIAVLYGAFARLGGDRDGIGDRDGMGDRDSDADRDGGGDGNGDGDGDGDGDGAEGEAEDEARGGGDGERADPGTARRDLAFGLAVSGSILALGLTATWAMADHASSGPQTSIAVPADIVHMIAAAGWLGGLATLLVLLFRSPVPVPRAVVRRFSAVALSGVTLLAATGLYQGWRQVRTWDALTGTSYGQLLLVKSGTVALLVGLGWISRRWTARLGEPGQEAEREPASVQAVSLVSEDPDTPADPRRAAQLARQRAAVGRARQRRGRDADAERGGLRRSVLAETAVAAVVVVVTTALTGTPPARTADDAPLPPAVAEPAGQVSLTMPFDSGGPNGAGTAYIDIVPGGTGDNTIHIRTVGQNDVPLPAAELRLAVTLPAERLGPLRFEPLLVDVGHWTQPGFRLPRPGEWELALTIRTSDIDQVTETETFSIG
jgi:copper transport protein